MEQQSELLGGCEVGWTVGSLLVSGEIDVANARLIEQRIRALLGAGTVVVDCRAVTFFDVAGLHMLTRVGEAAITRDTVVLLRCSATVTETLNLCGVREIPGLVMGGDNQDGQGSPR